MIWSTDTGRKWLKEILVLCQNNPHKLLIVTGGLDMSILYDERFKISKQEIIEIASPEQLSGLNVSNENGIILLNSLVCDALADIETGLEYTKKYCRKQDFTFIYAPYALTSSDILLIKSKAQSKTTAAEKWITDIIHNIASAISKGIFPCYSGIIQVFQELEKEHSDILPSANICMAEYIEQIKKMSNFDRIKCWYFEHKNRMSRFNQDQDEWFILWSVGLAGMYDNEWEVVPALLEGPGLVNERIHRVIEANHMNIPPIYMAWVYYCENKYRLPGEGQDGYIIRYPVDVLGELQNCQATEEDLDLSRKALYLRNWLQHGENDPRSYYQYENICHQTCKTIISLLTRDGRKR